MCKNVAEDTLSTHFDFTLGDMSKEHGGRLHHDITVIEGRTGQV